MKGTLSQVAWGMRYVEHLMKVTGCSRKLAFEDMDAWVEAYPECFEECPKFCAEESARSWSE